ncbi:unnamed protein product [Schistosoma curassoni]|nr:unnamed protein product [Schistosoma curassoni]
MQPTYLEPLGSVNFSKFKTDISLRNTTQIVFSSSSATVCLYDIHKLDCFRDSPNWSHQFTWIPILDLKYLLDNVSDSPDDLYNWHISKVMFVNTSTTARQSLAAVLVNINQNRSLVCFFRSLSTAKCNITILVNGALTSLEWLPLIDIGCKPSESRSMNSTMDITDQDISKGTNKTLSSVLSVFDGCFALGFQQGLVGLLDMCLTHTRDDLLNDIPEASIAVERSHCLNCFSCKQPISQSSNDNIEHSLVYLDASVLRWNDFTYKSVSGKTLSSIPSAGVYVSALSYIPQLQGLAVGFSFGGWQLWSLDRLNMEFCLRQATPATPVVSFNFLEPSDDPRFCCFIWVGWQSKQETESDGVFRFTGKQNSAGNFQSPTVKLFQLSYRRRYELFSNKHKEFNFYYQDLIGIAERLSTTLSGDKIDDNKPQYTSRLLSVQSLHAPGDFIMDNNNYHHPNNNNNSNAVISHSIGMIRLIAFIWKFSESVIRIGVFDLDRWYHAQMPTYIRSDDTFVSIFDALIPNQKVHLLHTYLIESSLMSFWSRIVQRESNLIQYCQSYPILINSTINSTNNHHHHHHHYKRLRPIPEIFLRPSSLSFHCLIFWTNDISYNNNNNILNFSMTQQHRHRTTTNTTHQYYDCIYHLSRIMFVSYQEECLIELNQFIKKSSLNYKKFNIIQWLSNAWKYGLLESPGLDQFDDDEEFMNLLNYTQNTTLIKNKYTTDNTTTTTNTTNINDYGIHLTLGDYYDQSIIDSLNKLLYNLTTEQFNSNTIVDDDHDHNDDDDDDCISSKRHCKYRRIDQSVNSSLYSKGIKTLKKKYQYSLDPCWVLLANCLLEHGCINVLKNLENLSPLGQDSPINLNFKYSWIWLRFCRLKSRFDKLTSVLFMTKSSNEVESVLSNSTDHSHSRIPDLLELGCTINQIQLLATLAKHWFIGKNHNSIMNNPRQFHLSTKLSLTSRQHPIEFSIKTYLSYAKLVVFLFRLGLLPQANERFNDNKFFTDSSYRINNTVLLPYNSSMLTETISELRCTRHHPVDFDNNDNNDCNTNRLTSISDHILYSSLQAPSKHLNNSNHTYDNYLTNSEVHDIWKEQEHLTSSSSSSSSSATLKPTNSSHPSNQNQSSLDNNELPNWLNYPPNNLQSLCALWQLPYNRQIKKSRLIILGFILCDSAAETLFHQSNYDEHYNGPIDEDNTDVNNNSNNNVISNEKTQTTQMINNIKSTNSSSLRALQLCRYVMSLFIKEFPSVYSLIPTIISLWLMDRGYFQESISSDIISFIMNSTEIQSSISSYYQIHNDLFPNQTNLIIHLFKKYDQGDLIHELLKHLTNYNNNNSSLLNYNPNNLKVQLSFQQLFNKITTINSTIMNNNNSDHKLNMKPIGAPYLALSKLRNLIHKMNRLHNQTPLPTKVLNSIDKLARNSLIQLAEICRQAGRLSDLISLGLNSWEAKVLFEYYEKTGQQNLLFHCLIARSQYQTALEIFNNYHGVLPYHKTKLLHGNTTNSTVDHDEHVQRLQQLDLMIQLMNSCLPLLNTNNEFNQKSIPSNYYNHQMDHYKALANEYVNMDDIQTNSESSSFIHHNDDDDNHHNNNIVDNNIFESIHHRQPSSSSILSSSSFTQSQSSLPQMDHGNFIAYKQTTPLIYPLTDLKKSNQLKKPTLNKYQLNSRIGNPYSYDNMDDDGDDDRHLIEDEIIRNNRINKSNSWLLTTNKKSRQEFWNTFKELQDLHESCGLNSNIWLNDSRCRLMDYTTINTTNSTVVTPTQPVNLNESRLKLTKKREFPSKDDDLGKYLFKCIYTPPSCGRKQIHSNTITNRLMASSNSLFNNSISSPFNQKPISILKTKMCLSNKEISVTTMADSMKTTITTTTTTTTAAATIVSSSSSLPSSLLFSTSLNPVISSSSSSSTSSSSSSSLSRSTYTTNITNCSNIKNSSHLMNENNLLRNELNLIKNTTDQEISNKIYDNNNDDCNVDEDDDDCDVTLNLSTVRPSIVNTEKFQHKLLQDNVNNKCNEFTFSAPHRLSLTPSNTPIVNKSMEKNEFLFSAPLVNKTIKHNQSIDNNIDKVSVLPISMDESNQSSSNATTTTTTNTTDNNNDFDESTINCDQMNTAKTTYLIELDNTTSLTKTPIVTPIKLQNPTVVLDQFHTKETTYQLINNDVDNKEDTTPKVTVKSRKTQSILDHLDSLHQQHNYHHYHYPYQPIDMDDNDDNSSVTSSMTDSSETVRRSTRRVRPPKRYDSSAV